MKYDGTKWVVSDDAGGISDVPNDSQKYVWEFNNWVLLSENLGLNDLNDVFINEPPQIGQVLAYGGNNRFENYTIDISTQ